VKRGQTGERLARLPKTRGAIVLWVRLQIGDLPILWTGAGRAYNPDFIGDDRAGVHWIVEVKLEKEMGSTDVQGKRQAAQRWADHVSADEQVRAVWCYLLVSESDVAAAHGSWSALACISGY
jgi:type III restriction enzyme